MTAALDDAALLQHHDAVCIADGGQPTHLLCHSDRTEEAAKAAEQAAAPAAEPAVEAAAPAAPQSVAAMLTDEAAAAAGAETAAAVPKTD